MVQSRGSLFFNQHTSIPHYAIFILSAGSEHHFHLSAPLVVKLQNTQEGILLSSLLRLGVFQNKLDSTSGYDLPAGLISKHTIYSLDQQYIIISVILLSHLFPGPSKIKIVCDRLEQCDLPTATPEIATRRRWVPGFYNHAFA